MKPEQIKRGGIIIPKWDYFHEGKLLPRMSIITGAKYISGEHYDSIYVEIESENPGCTIIRIDSLLKNFSVIGRL